MAPPPVLSAGYRTALVTGASGGIGRALSLWFARRGVKVYAAARRLEALQDLAREVGSEGEIIPVRMDVAQAAATVEALCQLDDQCGGLDLVIANAAVAPETPGTALAWSAVEQIIDVNVRGAAATLTATLDRMVARRNGHLVGLSSLAAGRGAPRNGGYSASKSFLTTFLEGLRVDLQGSGVKVTAVHPGFVRTPSTAGNRFTMPFILEVDDAADRIGRGILRGDSELSFPWPAAAIARFSRLLPNALWDLAARSFDPSRDPAPPPSGP